MGLRKEKLESFKKDLLARHQLLAQELKQATDDLNQDDSAYADTVDQASAITERSLMMQITARSRGVLLQLEDALRRIDAGNFGECESCSEPISEPRMRANPSTTLCIDCKAELESEQNRYPGGRG